MQSIHSFFMILFLNFASQFNNFLCLIYIFSIKDFGRVLFHLNSLYLFCWVEEDVVENGGWEEEWWGF